MEQAVKQSEMINESSNQMNAYEKMDIQRELEGD